MKKTVRKSIIASVLLAMTLLAPYALVSCEKYEKKAISGKTTVMCDESFKNVLDDEISVFEYQYPQAEIEPKYVGETEALDSLLKNKCEMIITYRELTKEQQEYLKNHNRKYRCRQIAVDGVALIANNALDIDNLSMENLRDIFSGRITTWGKIYPTKFKNDTIRVIFDGNGSAAQHFIRDKFLNGKQFTIKLYAEKSSEDVFRAVMKGKNTLGVVGVSWLSANLDESKPSMEQRMKDLESNEASSIDFTDKIKVMGVMPDGSIEGVKPYQAYLYDASYPLYRPIYAIDTSYAGLAHDFYIFVTSAIGQKIVLQSGIVPAAEPVRVVQVETK